MKPKQLQRILGFTLLEVLIALAILAISSIAVISQSGHSLSQLNRLQQKTSAVWLAENQLNFLLSTDNWPTPGRSTKTQTFSGQEWRVDTEVSDTTAAGLRKIEVVVLLEAAGKVQPLTTLIGYKGRD